MLRLPGPDQEPLSLKIQPWQAEDFQALDTAWMQLAGVAAPSRKPVRRRAYFERPRGHSKTSDMAVQIAWILLAARHPVQGIAAAADQEQATFLLESLRRLAEANSEILGTLQVLQQLIRNRLTGSRLTVISSDVRSSYGLLPDFIVCDELSHWPRPEMWHSLLSSAAKKPQCVLTILTNAGAGHGWQWEVREHARTHSQWHFSSLDGPQAPWITPEWLREQQALLPTPVYERLWLNRWQAAEGNFLTLPEVEACRDGQWSMQQEGVPGRHYLAAVDYAEKHDFTVGCICHREGEQIVVDRMDVVKPTPAAPTQVSWVERWMEQTAARFEQVEFMLDDYQLVGTIQRLQSRYSIRRFPFAGGEGNHRLTVTLRNLILHRRVRWYEGCGQVPDETRDDLETELASLILRQSASGRVRIDHHQDGIHHDDRAFALGVCCVSLLEQASGGSYLEITPPSLDGSFNW
jgi:hypothetical protein